MIGDPEAGFAVIESGEAELHGFPDGRGRYRVPVDASVGCRNLMQVVVTLPPGEVTRLGSDTSEGVLYVAAGRGTARLDSSDLPIEQGTGVFAPAGLLLELAADDELVFVAVLSPPPASARPWGLSVASAQGRRPAVLRERDQEPLPAGDDRTFKLMIDPRVGCRNVTQFVGSIERSRAPFHTHPYEEVIYILGGNGIVHAGEHSTPIGAGCSVYLSPGTPHCLENAGGGTLRLLGVFSPAGSPADKKEDT